MGETVPIRRSVWGLDIGNGQWVCAHLRVEELAGVRRVISAESSVFGYEEVPPVPEDCPVVVIDVPIGLLADEDATATEKGRSGNRAVDTGARKWCHSPSSVFPPPTTGQLTTGMAEHSRAAGAKDKRNLKNVVPGGLTQQTLELLPAISSAQRLKELYPDRVFEAHPEVIFAALANGIVPSGKLSLTGSLARAVVLSERLGIDCLRWVLERENAAAISADNWLDALALASVGVDWLKTDGRKALLGKAGLPELWNGQSDRLMAIPHGTVQLPKRLSAQQAIDRVFVQLAETIKCAVPNGDNPTSTKDHPDE